MTERQPQHQTPGQNADVVGIGQRLDRIGHQLHQQILQHGRDATGRHLIGLLHTLEHQLRGKQEAQRHRHQRRGKRAQHIQDEDRPDVGFRAPLMLRNGRHHEREHQYRCHCLQGAHEQVAQQLTRRKNPGRPALRNVFGTGHHGLPTLGAPTQPARQQCHADRGHQPNGNPADQIEPSPRPDDSLSCHTKPLSVGVLGETRPAPPVRASRTGHAFPAPGMVRRAHRPPTSAGFGKELFLHCFARSGPLQSGVYGIVVGWISRRIVVAPGHPQAGPLLQGEPLYR